MVPNKALILKRYPDGMPVAGQDLTVEPRDFKLECPPPAGGIVTKNLYASFDPYMRSRMDNKNKGLYFAPFPLDQPITSICIAKVLKSDTPKISEGQLIVGFIPVEEYSQLTEETLKMSDYQVIQNPYSFDIVEFLGPLGMPGLTAYASLFEIGKPKKGETILVSAASGAVGQLVGQFAKREGLRVIGSVGSDEKLDFIVNELKFDGGFNYKLENPVDAIKRLAPDGVDIYYDNVGGEQLDAALGLMNHWGRIVACGMISQYNNQGDQRYGIKNLLNVVPLSLTMRGFLVSSPEMGPKYFEERNTKVSQWLSDGSLKSKIHMTQGIANAPQGFVGMMQGKNFGKAVLKIADQ
ncbi:NADP-dependent oxidoreductase RED1 [Golovinomyces cichoracearum]|uniref:NADP-dependent oxidoreductase RED1 n=1 Tax=Golovinomyces cichoracearum TaxID=62708 RepID=A0A420HA20_9PEZI|nr:NADP-dependent oxidoreductase RED1 [Golovinomyces cichoracearum]